MKKGKIIIHVDDDEDDRMWVKTIIEDHYPDVQLIQFADGDSALFYIGQLQIVGQPSLVILDINMPKKDGRMVLKEMHEDMKLSGIPVVLFTTSESALDKSFARKHHVELVTKPPTEKSLVSAIQKIMDYAR